MFSRFIYIVAVAELHYFLWLEKILLYVDTTLCLSIHMLMDSWVVCIFWPCERCSYEQIAKITKHICTKVNKYLLEP